MRILLIIIALNSGLFYTACLPGQTQYITGVQVLDTIYTLFPNNLDSCAPDYDIALDVNLFNVTGIELYLVIDSIAAPLNSVSTYPGSILSLGDTLPIPSIDSLGGYEFYFSQGVGGFVSCRLMAEGIPQIPGETYACDSFVVVATSALCSNIMTISGSPCTVICGGPPIVGFKNKISASGSGFLSNFIDTSLYATSWFWDFGDGGTDSVQNAAHIYADSGDYTVCLIVTNACGADTLCSVITAYCEVPIADFDTSFVGAGVDFFDSSIAATSWLWDFGDGNQSTLQQPYNLYLDTGTYTVCLIAGNNCGLDTVCKDIVISCALPDAAFVSWLTGSDFYSVEFSDQSLNALTWNWAFGDGGQSTDPNPIYTYPTTGVSTTYIACLTVTNGCGSDSICDPVFIIVPLDVTELGKDAGGTLKCIPNPFSMTALISVPERDEFEDAQFLMYNALGELVFSYQMSGKNNFVLHAEHLPRGIYMLRMVSDIGTLYQERAVLIH